MCIVKHNLEFEYQPAWLQGLVGARSLVSGGVIPYGKWRPTSLWGGVHPRKSYIGLYLFTFSLKFVGLYIIHNLFLIYILLLRFFMLSVNEDDDDDNLSSHKCNYTHNNRQVNINTNVEENLHKLSMWNIVYWRMFNDTVARRRQNGHLQHCATDDGRADDSLVQSISAYSGRAKTDQASVSPAVYGVQQLTPRRREIWAGCVACMHAARPCSQYLGHFHARVHNAHACATLKPMMKNSGRTIWLRLPPNYVKQCIQLQ